MPIAGPPGLSYYCDNTNHSILQGVIEEQSGMDYTDYVTENVLIRAGIDPQIVNADPATPNAPQTGVYGGPNDSSLARNMRSSLWSVSAAGFLRPESW